MPPSAIFYSDTLVPCATNGVLKWSGLPNFRVPLRFIGHKSDEDTNDHDRVRFSVSFPYDDHSTMSVACIVVQ